jgi:hypothetical protein
MGNVSRRMYRWTFGVLLTGALAIIAMPAMAQRTDYYYGPNHDFTYPCFGYTGTFKAGSRIALVDWQQDGSVDECFGIAPDSKGKTIWHAWRNSGGWKEMPHNGHADDTGAGYRHSNGNRYFTVSVEVRYEVYEDWESTYSNNAWGPWYRFYGAD